MIIDEENISTETRMTSDLFVNALPVNQMTSSPSGNTNDTDDSFHSAVDENDKDPLIINMDITNEKENNKTFRKALGCIKNRLVETPKKDMRRKLWRNMEDERYKKVGKMGIENTPPFKDITASAPPKLYGHCKRT